MGGSAAPLKRVPPALWNQGETMARQCLGGPVPDLQLTSTAEDEVKRDPLEWGHPEAPVAADGAHREGLDGDR